MKKGKTSKFKRQKERKITERRKYTKRHQKYNIYKTTII